MRIEALLLNRPFNFQCVRMIQRISLQTNAMIPAAGPSVLASAPWNLPWRNLPWHPLVLLLIVCSLVGCDANAPAPEPVQASASAPSTATTSADAIATTGAPKPEPIATATPEVPATTETPASPVAPNQSVQDEKEAEAAETAPSTKTSTIVPPSRAYLPPNRNTAPPPPLPAPKSDKELAEEKKTREAAKKRGEITFDALVFDMEKGAEFKEDMLGPDNWDLNGKTWKIRGFILPTTLFSQTGITEFVLVRDNQECCFGPGAALYDCIIVTMEPGKSISYTTRVVTVKGKLEIDTESFRYPDEEEGHYAIYKMTAEEVK